jgi:hypothetical protein
VTLILANLVRSFETVAIVRVILKGRLCLENTSGLIVWPGWLDRSQVRWSGCYSLFLSLSI